MSDNESVEGEDWLTIQQAAAYLGVSEPTLFRWMKEGLVSFYKVGRSTRFTRKSLAAVIEKRTGKREVEQVRARCLACGHTALAEGRIQSTGRVFFRPLSTRFWTFHEALAPTKALVCTACGHVQMYVDLEKLKKIMPGEADE